MGLLKRIFGPKDGSSSRVSFLTKSGSQYSMDESGLLLKNGKPIGKREDRVYYMGLVNSFKFQMNDGNILPEFFEYESPDGIREYMRRCPPRPVIERSLNSGIVQSYMVQLVGISGRSIKELKREFRFDSDSMKEFGDTLVQRIEQERPAGKVAIVPYDYATNVLTASLP